MKYLIPIILILSTSEASNYPSGPNNAGSHITASMLSTIAVHQMLCKTDWVRLVNGEKPIHKKDKALITYGVGMGLG